MTSTYSKITIAGVEYTDSPRVQVIKSIGNNNTISTFEAEFDNVFGEHASSFQTGQDVEIFADTTTNPPTTKIFKGTISEVNFDDRANTGKIMLIGKDLTTKLIDTTVEPVSFSNTEVSVIVTTIMSSNVSSITTTNVDVTSKTIDNIRFNHVPVFDALQQLAELSGFFFFVDETGDLNFKLKNVTSSGKTLDNTNVLKSNLTESDQDLKNRVFVYGDRQLSRTKESFTADGGSVFDLDFKPFNTEVFVAGSAQPKRGGVFGLVTIPPSGVDYLVDFDGQNVIFVSGTTAGNQLPVSGEAVVVNYQKSTPIIKFALDQASIDSYNVKTQVIQDKNIVSANQAQDVALSTISEKSSPLIQIDLELQGILLLTPGETAVVNLPYLNVSNQTYTILEVSYEFTKEKNFSETNVKVKVSKRKFDLTDTIKGMILDIKKLQAQDASETDVLSRIETATGSVGARVKTWSVLSATVGSDWYVGSASLANGSSHPNSWVGSPGSFWAGSHTVSLTTQITGGDV